VSNNLVAVVTGCAGQVVVGLIALAAIAVFVFGYRPKHAHVIYISGSSF
jgi:hypothetical protein